MTARDANSDARASIYSSAMAWSAYCLSDPGHAVMACSHSCESTSPIAAMKKSPLCGNFGSVAGMVIDEFHDVQM